MTHTIAAAAVLVLVGLAQATGAAEAVNLAPNPGFELADGTQPAFWQQRTPTDDQRVLSWDAAVRRSDERSLKIENNASVLSRWRTGHLREMALEPGTKALFSAWIRTQDVKGTAHLKLYCMDARGGILAQPQSKGVAGTSDWAEVRLPVTVPQATGYVMLYLELKGAGSAWFDDVVLTGTPGKRRVKMNVPPLTYAASDFEVLDGFALGRRGRRSVITLSPKARRGKAQAIFWGDTARYDLTVTCADERDGRSALRLLVNGREAAKWLLDQTPADAKTQEVFRDKLIRGVDLQRLSRITLEAEVDGEEFCRIEKIAFRPRGRFQGEFLPADKLRVPPTLRVYGDLVEQRSTRDMLRRFVSQGTAQASDAREKELAALKTPADWRARQQRTRARLPEFFGDFEPKCPLNPRITGKLDRPDYVIEKVIFESQPGYHCTANLYLPKRRKPPLPAILFTCGHAGPGKAYHLYHECCLGLVLKGYVVLGLDPTGQGERSEYFDTETGKDLVPRTVSQHHYLSRPSWLVGRTLAGYRTWDCIRAIDYLVTRPEVDAKQIGACGNSGGGIMALLITAADERVKVCAAAHPGGSMEQTYLTGQRLTEKEILSLIPPRPCAMIVGTKSGEQGGHQAKLDDMWRFYEGLGVGRDRGKMLLVDGVHNMKKPKREAAYEWLNQWFGKQAEGAKEPELKPETVETLHCSKTGYVLRDLGGESGQTLNAKLADKLRPPRPLPRDAKALDPLRKVIGDAVARRIGLSLGEKREAPPCGARGTFEGEGFAAEKLELETEPGITVPAVLLKPKQPKPAAPVVVHAAELGKPTSPTRPSLALGLVARGHTVLSIDVRGAGETDPRDRRTLKPLRGYEPQQFRFDGCAVRAAAMGTTLLGMRAKDVVRAMDYLAARKELAGRPVALVGEGLGGLWVLAAAAFEPRASSVVCVGTVPSYKLIVGSRYYASRDYFWVPGALRDFDVPDLVGLVAPRPVLLLDAADARLEPLAAERCRAVCQWPQGVYRLLGAGERLGIVRTPGGTLGEVVAEVAGALERTVRTTRPK